MTIDISGIAFAKDTRHFLTFVTPVAAHARAARGDSAYGA